MGNLGDSDMQVFECTRGDLDLECSLGTGTVDSQVEFRLRPGSGEFAGVGKRERKDG